MWVYKTAFYLRTDGFGNQSFSPLPGFLKSFLQPLALDSGVTPSPRPPIGSLPELLLGRTLPVSPSPEPLEDGAGVRAVKGREVLAEGPKCQTQRPVPLASSQQVALLVPTGPRDSRLLSLAHTGCSLCGSQTPRPAWSPSTSRRAEACYWGPESVVGMLAPMGCGGRRLWRLGCTWPPTLSGGAPAAAVVWAPSPALVAEQWPITPFLRSSNSDLQF